MTALLEWLKTWDFSAVLSTIIIFATTYGGSILALVIGLIKTRVKNFQFQEALEKMQIQLSEEQTQKIEEMRKAIVDELTIISANIINNENANALERKKLIQGIIDDANEANAEIQELPVTANDVLDSLE